MTTTREIAEPTSLQKMQTSADHAELARLAEAAKSRLASGEWRADPNSPSFIWGDSLKGGDTHVAMVRGWGYLTGGGHGAIGLSEEDGLEAQFQVQRFIAAANPATVLSLLSEIAALRGERDRLKLAICGGEDVPGAIDAVTVEDCERFCRENEASRGHYIDQATQAERQRDELRKALERIADEAPYRSGYCQSDVEYGPALSADEMQAVARQALSNHGDGQ